MPISEGQGFEKDIINVFWGFAPLLLRVCWLPGLGRGVLYPMIGSFAPLMRWGPTWSTRGRILSSPLGERGGRSGFVRRR